MKYIKAYRAITLINRLYPKADMTDEQLDEMTVRAMEQNETKSVEWENALEPYDVYDIEKAIKDYYRFKSSKTKPNLTQILVNLEGKETIQETHQQTEKVELPFWLKFQQQDRDTGDMSWLVPHYQIVGRLILQDYFPFVQNIYNPSYEDFRVCMKRWSVETYGREYFVESDNQFNALPPEVQKEKLKKAKEIIGNFHFQRLN